ncbi:MAG: hypothetical protein LBQ00_02720 [Syntrophobacterales bacterium]|jgi:hypothetical protein|nr:hypothetical protein [Syntrophobacterales bacterium]
MEINERLARELKKKFEIEQNRYEVEVLEYWKAEINAIYKKKYESLASLQVDMKNLINRINNRIIALRH